MALDKKQEQFLKCIAAGDDFRYACKKAGIKAVTYARWRMASAEFRSRLTEATQLRDALLIESLYAEARAGDTAARKAYLEASRKDQDREGGAVLKLYGYAAKDAIEAV